MNVSVRELKAHLSEYLRRVQAGEEFDVTLRGRPIARLGATLAAHRTNDPEAAIRAELESLSWVRPGNGGKPELLEREQARFIETAQKGGAGFCADATGWCSRGCTGGWTSRYSRAADRG